MQAAGLIFKPMLPAPIIHQLLPGLIDRPTWVSWLLRFWLLAADLEQLG
jgi:hypothetical protein